MDLHRLRLCEARALQPQSTVGVEGGDAIPQEICATSRSCLQSKLVIRLHAARGIHGEKKLVAGVVGVTSSSLDHASSAAEGHLQRQALHATVLCTLAHAQKCFKTLLCQPRYVNGLTRFIFISSHERTST